MKTEPNPLGKMVRMVFTDTDEMTVFSAETERKAKEDLARKVRRHFSTRAEFTSLEFGGRFQFTKQKYVKGDYGDNEYGGKLYRLYVDGKEVYQRNEPEVKV